MLKTSVSRPRSRNRPLIGHLSLNPADLSYNRKSFLIRFVCLDLPKSDMFVKKGLCPVNVGTSIGTNTEFVTPDVDDAGLHQVEDEIEADDLEPVRYRPTVSTAAVGVQVDQVGTFRIILTVKMDQAFFTKISTYKKLQ